MPSMKFTAPSWVAVPGAKGSRSLHVELLQDRYGQDEVPLGQQRDGPLPLVHLLRSVGGCADQ